MLVELEERHHYPSLFGIPIHDFPNCLAWFQQDIVRRRIPMYSSWSWCGWTHPVNFLHSDGVRQFRACLLSIYCPSMSTNFIWQSNSIKASDTKTESSSSPVADKCSSKSKISTRTLKENSEEKFWSVIMLLLRKTKPKDRHYYKPLTLSLPRKPLTRSLPLHSLIFFDHDEDLDLYKALVSWQRTTYSDPITNVSWKLSKAHLMFSAFVLTTHVRIFHHHESPWQLRGRPMLSKKGVLESDAVIRFNHIMGAGLMLSLNDTIMTFVLIYTHHPDHDSVYDNAVMLIVQKQDAEHYERVEIAEMSEQAFIKLQPQIERIILG